MGVMRLRFPNSPGLNPCHESIYRFVYNHPSRDHFIQLLRKKHKRRKGRSKVRRGGLHYTRSIRERPKSAEERTEIGHWEGDLIVGEDGESAMGTLVDRMTRYTMIMPLQAKDSAAVMEAFYQALLELPEEARKTLTYDRGSEMARHEELTRRTGVPVYFADAKCPWQRGSNENTNGLLREFFPKKTNLYAYTIEEVAHVQRLLNLRPRKILGYASPKEVFQQSISRTLNC